jgi:hypothetical protein
VPRHRARITEGADGGLEASDVPITDDHPSADPAHHGRRRYSKQFSTVNDHTADGTGTHL